MLKLMFEKGSKNYAMYCDRQNTRAQATFFKIRAEEKGMVC